MQEDLALLLKKNKEEINQNLDFFLQEKKQKIESVDQVAKEMWGKVSELLLAGGKRLRPILLRYAFLASGGKDLEKTKFAELALELAHAYLLVHDDIIDRDDLRRGKITTWAAYRKKKEAELKEEAAHYGNSMAICVGDLIATWSNELFLKQFIATGDESVIKALGKFQEILELVIIGEAKDTELGYSKEASEEEVLKIHQLKTSSYTFEGPMLLGAILAGNNEAAFLKQISLYATNLGIAFQLRDDILGLMGDEKKLGKAVGSDVSEGKQTLLTIKALEFGNQEECSIIRKLLGKRDLTKKELEQFREVVVSTGSLEYSQQQCASLVQKALESLTELKIANQEARYFFEEIANYIIERKV